VRTDSDWGFATPYEDVGGEVAIAGVGESDHSKASGRTAREIAAQAVERALDDAGLRPEDVDGIMYTPVAADFDEHAFR
jgi:acetyl-CoA acetyltransferase